jgi:hypothetical protein
MTQDLVRIDSAEFARQAEPNGLLARIRPSWQARDLIGRVKRLIAIDPSSACQRLFNAAIHDLREKIVVAGIDIAKEAARLHGLPPIEKDEDVENYSVARLIELAYRIGLLSRAEWRRLARCYEIRRDLEHEDDEYEAGVEDCVYIFKTCVEVILSRDPIHLLRVIDVKQLVEQPAPVLPSEALIADYAGAPQPRQEEILKFLVSKALDAQQSDIVQQNAYNCLLRLEQSTQNAVKLRLAAQIQSQVGRKGFDLRTAKVALAAGAFPYLRQADISDFFETQYKEMVAVGPGWRQYPRHGELLRSFQEVGGLTACPESQRKKILKFLVQTYLGEPGGMTSWGNVRYVFYSNTAAPVVEDLIKESAQKVSAELTGMRHDAEIKRACGNPHIARRFESLLDLVAEHA